MARTDRDDAGIGGGVIRRTEEDRREIEAAARRTPGENIEIGLKMSDRLVALLGGSLPGTEVSMVELWRNRHKRK